ncbi:MAG: HAD family hydrolase [Candidatus Moranbacteria bacterium]|nr:HAD family hydrolase [Candidatus Moranbacteria bacterium]
MNKKTKAVIFDFDGVIADTFEFHRKHFKKYLNLSLSKKEYQNLHKGNVFDGKDLNDKEKIISENLVKYFKFIEKDHHNVKSFKRINALLKMLNEKYNLFIITSSSKVNIINFLKRENVFDCFTEILGVEFDKSKVVKFNYILEKYKLEKDDVLFVTDTSGDVFEANKVGVKSIAVTWGFHDREILAESEPFAYADDVEKVLEIVESNL